MIVFMRCATAVSIFLSLIFTFSPLLGSSISLNRKQFFVGPVVYDAHRTKTGGTKQRGTINGIRIGYDRLKRYGWYIGAEGLYARGTLNGHSATHAPLRSKLRDSYVEGRFGYTFQQKEGWQLSFTPFAGGGYFMEKNQFRPPSPYSVDFHTRFSYAAVGVLTWAHVCEYLELGANFRVRYPLNPRCKITNGMDHDDVSQKIAQRLQYFVELPITYRLSCESHLAIALAPFFESRLYGGHPNYPFNFIKTRFENWGATLEFEYRL